ncbi:PocR ligand-binding domain-containing protein [Desulfovibrio inopinatus]|uniref:PocR ligand-binding domain-containing protein n=1 Tax=Desulfovibrio inopinatus TaxID=102109 RepID=UPI00040527EE|nr:PocR ligand-binding domain-containing protein [Desulfovibrio inopinatus]
MEDCDRVRQELQKELSRAHARIAFLEQQNNVLTSNHSATIDGSAIWFRNLVETIPDLVWLKDMDGVFLGCNPTFERFLGVQADEIIGKTDYDFVDTQRADFFREHDRKAIAAGGPSSNEEWLTFADNGYHGLFETIKTPMRDAEGTTIGVLGIARDITDRKRVEEALEKRLIALTQPLDDLGEITFDDLFNLDDIQRLQDEFARATGVSSLIIKPDGTPITKPSNLCRLCRDISRETDIGIANCYKSDMALGRISSTGPTIQPCTSGGLWDAGAGISIGGRHIANWLIGLVRDTTQTEEAMREYARKIGTDETEFIEAFNEVPAMTKERFEEVAEALYTLANQLSSMAYQNMLQARFISERKRTEKQLIEMKDKAEAANIAKSEFLANMSHEIRTPLNGVLGMLQLLCSTDLTSKQQGYVSAAIQSSERLTRLLSDILDLSRIEAGKIQIVNGSFNLEVFMRSIQDLFTRLADEKGLELTWSIDADVPTNLVGDEIRLRQILFNLVGNALKFTAQGAVRITIHRLLCNTPLLVKLLFIVSDTGVGIADDVLKAVFEPFVQVEGAYSRRFQGAGLGLSIVRKLVRLMGGELAIDNTGPGTVMYLSMPLMVAHSTTLPLVVEDHDGSPSVEKKARILFAEDDEVTLIAASETLINHGYVVDTARDGREVLDLLTQNDYDIILMDIQMPVLDGVTVTRTIRHAPELASKATIPIIAMTAYAMSGDREKFLEAGMDEYISKPVDMEKLMKLIDQVLYVASSLA